VSLAGKFLRIFGLADPSPDDPEAQLQSILNRREALAARTGKDLRREAANLDADNLIDTFAIAAIAAERLLGLRMFDVQLRGALALQRGHIAEMQTGEGKTLAAVPAIVHRALQRRGMHVLTANDYLARRDAAWMRPIFEFFGLRAAHLSQGMTQAERLDAYNADITYATATEAGFDYLRDGLALTPNDVVQRRGLVHALFDEADSILLDEARIPLIIAGESAASTGSASLATQADAIASALLRHRDFRTDEHGRNVHLTDAGIATVEATLQCGSLFDAANLAILTAVQDALHAHALLKRDVDYVVKQGAIELVDEFKGRIAENRRMPAGLHSALEAKEGVNRKNQGRILGSITLQSLASLYENICGMTGTAATQAQDFWKEYKLPVTVIPPNKPVLRQDLPDVLFRTRIERDNAVLREIQRTHASQRPILVGTASVEESEALSARLSDANIPHAVLNARNDEAEAGIIAQAGAPRAVTISTNMAGRGADIPLGSGAADLGGLYVIGTSKHEARRIDFQLRGRAGRQGDPGSTRFFVSLEDSLFTRHLPEQGFWPEPVDVDHIQRIAEGVNFELRQLLFKYESVLEHQRLDTWRLRREVLLSPDWSVSSLLSAELFEEWTGKASPDALNAAGRPLALALIDDLWADYLAAIAELRSGVHWVTFAGKDPLHAFLTSAQDIHESFQSGLETEIEAAFESASVGDNGEIQFPSEVHRGLERGATWTYLTTDQPFGTMGERIAKGLLRKLARR
jgi:preprotein translocase subunit SecA